MPITRVIFEKGIEIGPSRNSVVLPNNTSTFAEIFALIWDRYKVRPVLSTEIVPTFAGLSRDRHSVLTLDARGHLNLLLSSLKLPQGMAEKTYISLLRASMNIQYVAGAVVYHCQELALLYADICENAVDIREKLPIEGKSFSFQGQSEGYYEFDALITAARRTYDALRYIMWPAFGSGSTGTPRNFDSTLTACDRLPQTLRETLLRSWRLYGEKLTAYRDCVQHNAPVSFGIETACMQQVDGDKWSVMLRIPDNPETKSPRHFQFAGGIDALTYGWELANEVITIAAEVLASLPVGG